MDEDTSVRLRLLRFPLVLGVLYIHAYDAPTFIRNLVSQKLARISVPLFFLMAGYFFVGGTYFQRAGRRVKSLVIPYVFWNLLMFAGIALAQTWHVTQPLFKGGLPLFSSLSPREFFYFFIGHDGPPPAYQFWFIRDLIVVVFWAAFFENLILPVFVILSGYCWFVQVWFTYIPCTDAAFLFSLGLLWRKANLGLKTLDKVGKPAMLLYPLILAWGMFVHNTVLAQTGLFVGILSVLAATKYMLKMEKLKAVLIWLSAPSFFIFAAHEPLQTVLTKIIYKFFTPSLFLYFFRPLLVVAILLVLDKWLKRVAPSFLSVISGGR